MKKYLILLIVFLIISIAIGASAQYMMGPGHGTGMMGGAWDYIPPASVEPLDINDAAEVVRQYLDIRGNPDLKLEEVMEFSNHFYAEIEEESSGIHAFELLVNKYTGDIFPEPGPNMMWNTKYGHMKGRMMGYEILGGQMCGRSRRYESWKNRDELRITPDQAVRRAQRFLDSQLTGVKTDGEVDAFYGYYTIHTLKDGKMYGMLSVNGYLGQVWYHTWHGKFVRMKEFGEQE